MCNFNSSNRGSNRVTEPKQEGQAPFLPGRISSYTPRSGSMLNPGLPIIAPVPQNNSSAQPGIPAGASSRHSPSCDLFRYSASKPNCTTRAALSCRDTAPHRPARPEWPDSSARPIPASLPDIPLSGRTLHKGPLVPMSHIGRPGHNNTRHVRAARPETPRTRSERRKETPQPVIRREPLRTGQRRFSASTENFPEKFSPEYLVYNINLFIFAARRERHRAGRLFSFSK